MTPTVEVFAICYNEEFMLPFFIEHYKKHFNASITIYDNYSTDNSRQIALDAGCTVINYDSGKQIRDDLYLDIKNNCWKKSKADWVIVCDVDEFLVVPFNVTGLTIINTHGFDMVGPVLTHLGVPSQMASKHIMFRPDSIKEINYQPGCHSCKPVGILNGDPKRFAELFHYKYVSCRYLYARHKMYEARLSTLNKQYGWGVHYQNTSVKSIKEKFDLMQQSSYFVRGLLLKTFCESN